MNIKRKSQTIIKKNIYPFVSKWRNFKSENNFIICGDPRGGTTWLAELLNNIPKTAIIWEPLTLHPESPFKKLDFNWRQFIPEDIEWPEAKAVFENVFEGKYIDAHLARTISFTQLLRSEQLIIKFCRANALLPWLINQFSFHYKPILLIRHPFAVVASQLKKGNWNYDFKSFEIPDTPYNIIFSEHEEFLKTIKTKEESLVAIWCITNLVPLRNKKNNINWITVNYENLVIDPETQINRIFNAWELPVPEKVFTSLRNPSSTTVKGSPIKGNKQVEYWKQKLTNVQVEKMMEVLNYFKCEYYNSDPYPTISF